MYCLPVPSQPTIIESVKSGAGASVGARPSVTITSRPSPVLIPRSTAPYTAPKPGYIQTVKPRTWTRPIINPMTNKPTFETPIILPRIFTYPKTQRTETYVRNPSVLPHPIFFLRNNTNVINNYQYEETEQSSSTSDQNNSDFADFMIFIGIIIIVGIVFLFITMN